jgi:hypothetical protein
VRIPFRALLARHALLLMLSVLGGCATVARDDAADGTAQRSLASNPAHDFLPVHDLPPQRDEPLIPAAQRDKIKAELIAAQRHAKRVSAKP